MDYYPHYAIRPPQVESACIRFIRRLSPDSLSSNALPSIGAMLHCGITRYPTNTFTWQSYSVIFWPGTSLCSPSSHVISQKIKADNYKTY